MSDLTYEVVMWDWKESVPWDEINRALRTVGSTMSVDQGLPTITMVPDTEGDDYAVIVGRGYNSPDDAQQLFWEWEKEQSNDDVQSNTQ